MIAPIVSSTWLIERLAAAPPTHEGRPLVVVDSRWYLDGRSGFAAYQQGHLPGAVWIDLDRWLSSHGAPSEGRHPLPTPEVFAEGMGAHGIGADSVVVVYDDQAGLVAGRLVWMLRRLGHDAAVLDGGLAAWTASPTAPPLETGDGPTPAPRPFPVQPWPADSFVTTDEVLARDPATTRLIDARAGERYRGETEPIDSQAGHIPGALSMPLTGNLGPDGCYLPVEQLAARYAPLLEDGAQVIAYCGSGVSACHDLIALEAAGHLGRLYVGSWSAWSSTPGLTVATGEQP